MPRRPERERGRVSRLPMPDSIVVSALNNPGHAPVGMPELSAVVGIGLAALVIGRQPALGSGAARLLPARRAIAAAAREISMTSAWGVTLRWIVSVARSSALVSSSPAGAHGRTRSRRLRDVRWRRHGSNRQAKR